MKSIFFHRTRKYSGIFLDLIFPRICMLCRETLSAGESEICTSCLSALPRTHIKDPGDNPVARMFWGRFPFSLATSLLVFEKGNPAQKIIHDIKYHGNKKLAVKMGKMLGLHLQSFDLFDSVDYLIPVPLHKRKKRLRGFNQSELLAEGISELSGKPVLESALERYIFNPTQTRKSRYERWENVSGIFLIKKQAMLTECHVLLVDDVITTGATIEACAQILMTIPGIRIGLSSLAYAL